MINYHYYTFLSVKDAVNFMNNNNVPRNLVVSLAPSQFLNGAPSEWVLVINQTSDLPFRKKHNPLLTK